MSRALELARRGIGLCSPNPQVGCVILDSDGVLAGEGWHEYELRNHAEIVAIREAGERARGGTAYVTLEPCNHTGRTGPCSRALIAAGVRRVVAATVDPNSLVAGQGLETLRRADVTVEVGVCQPEARRLNEGFARWIQSRRPFVLMKVAQTLDGKIAPGQQKRGQPHWITGEKARAEVQRMRWAADAVLTGVDTVVADDPLLTDRSGERRRRKFLRVMLDSSLRIPLDSKLVVSADSDLIVFTVSQDAERIAALTERGVRVVSLAPTSGAAKRAGAEAPVYDADPMGELKHTPPSVVSAWGEAEMRVSIDRVMDWLGSEEILTLLTEAGSRLNTALLAGGFVDRMRVFTSPQILGSDAVPAFLEIDMPVQLADEEVEQFGEDTSVSRLLRDPWACTSDATTGVI